MVALSVLPLGLLIFSLCLSTSTVSGTLRFCGQASILRTQTRPSRVQPRVVGGHASNSSYWPSFALLYSFSSFGDDALLCGASILDERWLLTAAHCIQKDHTHRYVVVAPKKARLFGSKHVRVRRAIVHPDVMQIEPGGELINDIALIELVKPIRLSMESGAVPVCLIRDDAQFFGDESNVEAYVMGFGMEPEVEGLNISQKASSNVTFKQADSLKVAKVPIIDGKLCEERWWTVSGGSVGVRPDHQICAGAWLKGTALGDSGGPLMACLTNVLGSPFYQIGITSYGADDIEGLLDQGSYPGVYTRVAPYIPWIERVIAESSLSGGISRKSLHLAFIAALLSLARSLLV